jgi:hypothetical protein
VKSSPRSPFMAENKLRMVVSWNPDIFTNDPQYSMLVELANWVQAEIYERPHRNSLPTHENDDCCLLLHVCCCLVWVIFGHMDKELLATEEKKRISRIGQTVEEANMHSKNVKELRKMLSEQGLPTSGRKGDLVSRLYSNSQQKKDAAINLLSFSERFVMVISKSVQVILMFISTVNLIWMIMFLLL